MRKEKPEKMPMPGRRLTEEEAKKIIEKFGLEYSDLEYFVVTTKDRGNGPKQISHYLHKWEKLPDQELGWIPVEEVIKAIQKYYPKIDPKEKYPTREAIRKLREAKKKKEDE